MSAWDEGRAWWKHPALRHGGSESLREFVVLWAEGGPPLEHDSASESTSLALSYAPTGFDPSTNSTEEIAVAGGFSVSQTFSPNEPPPVRRTSIVKVRGHDATIADLSDKARYLAWSVASGSGSVQFTVVVGKTHFSQQEHIELANGLVDA